ncbi:hypothetical protein SAY87_009420 [Trapa incisa]|uniref:TOG domain-containing protein n=2 Tax=Trapa TaxID=22665 RepID=A0AAN7M3H3_TRANT|nr:hypothetical protein SAY87_009420 [Trapa incisa]KAK4798495.1 hypothetical protein SAY86_030821 [Trapa natans]
MALRPLDNALPIAPLERPKKQAKLAVPTTVKKQQTDVAVVNDENQAPLPTHPSSGDAAIDYIPSENLSALPDPVLKIQSLMEGLESKDWTVICESLNTARRFALFHSDLMTPVLESVVLVLVKAMKNPRSALCKTSIMASSDILKAYGDKLLLDGTQTDAFSQMLLQLLLKASQDKKFVCEEAQRALNSMIATLTPLPLLHKLRAYVTHSNLRVRAKAAVSISVCVSKMGLETMKEFGLGELTSMAADLLNDKLPEAREAARSTVILLYRAAMEQVDEKQDAWEKFCKEFLPSKHVQSIIKLVASQ